MLKDVNTKNGVCKKGDLVIAEPLPNGKYFLLNRYDNNNIIGLDCHNTDIELINKSEIKDLQKTIVLKSIKPFLSEAIKSYDYWYGFNNKLDTYFFTEACDINIYWTDDNDIHKGISIALYGLKKDEETNKHLIDTNNELALLELSYEEIKDYIL